MKLSFKDPAKLLITFGCVVAIFISVTLVLPRVIKYLLPLILAVVISLVIDPMVDFLEKKCHINRRIAVLLSIIFVIAILGLIIFNLVYQAVYFIQSFAEQMPSILSREFVFLDWIGHINDYLIKLPESMQSFVENIKSNLLNNLSTFVAPATKATISLATTIASKLPTILIFTVVLILSTYFVSYDRNKLAELLKKFISEKRFNNLREIEGRLVSVCVAYLRAQIIMSGIIYCVLLAGFLVLQIQSAPFVALITAIVDSIPVLGTGTVLVPWAVFELLSGNYGMALGLSIIYVMAIIVRQFTEPRVVSTQIGLHPLITITSMYVGLKAIGVFGMILGPVITIIVIKTIEIEKEIHNER